MLPLNTAVVFDLVLSITEIQTVKWTDTYNAFCVVCKARHSSKDYTGQVA